MAKVVKLQTEPPSKIEIEKGIPIPPSKNPGYPFKDMVVGDSFYVDTDKRDALQNAANHARVALNRTFTVRKEGGGFRVWRTK